MKTRKQIYDILRDNYKFYYMRIPRKHLLTLKQIYHLKPGLEGNAIKLAVGALPQLKVGGQVILSGPVGVGKTIAAIILAIVYMDDQNADFEIINSRDVLRKDFDERTELSTWLNLVVVDDFGHEYFREDKNWGQDIWEDFIDTAYRETLPRVFTTNLTSEEIRQKYGERIYDRLREVGVWLTVTEKEGSFRGRKVEK